ncbi:hypothetical protein CDV31_016365 [Fusarium ambrosium]|uniref:Amino acid permease/ SLC12A domain-containing protein n=1 Tax=Fusarium ambrosium TaxID=131363 RepID=A0A428SA74_9HYPO|nr:hypothetical protein CDV31_016365 [Fusarium ambrosium]
MVGTGIYTAPATVFLMTGNKAVTLTLFFVGFLYSVVSMVIYLDFAEVLPFNGGELIYLNEITSHVSEPLPEPTQPPTTQISVQQNADGLEMSNLNRQGYAVLPPQNTETIATDRNQSQAKPVRWMRAILNTSQTWLARWVRPILGDGLLGFIIYSIAFIVFFNSGSNSLQFGRMILLCIDAKDSTNSNNPGETNEDQNKTSNEINLDVMRLIGVNVLTLICLLQYFSPGFGRVMNKWLAFLKIVFLFVLIGVADNAKDASDDWFVTHPTTAEQGNNENIGKPTKLAFAKALLAVLFSFEGWENATFVAGEIPAGKHHILRRGFIIAVFLVGTIYLAIVGLFLQAISWQDISDGHENVNYPPMFSQNNIRARRAWPIIAAISSFGSLNAIIYTFSRVKQAIGQAEIFPWSRYLKKDDKLQRDHDGPAEDDFLHKAPQGGLIAHWIMSVVVISASAGIPTTLEAVGLPGYIQTYIHCFFQGVLGIGFYHLKSRDKALWSSDTTRRHWFRRFLQILQSWLIVPIYIGLNGAILVINAMGPYKGTDGSSASFDGRGFPAMVGGILVIGIGYYVVFFGAASRLYEPLADGNDGAAPKTITKTGILKQQNILNLMRRANVQCEIRKNYTYDKKLERVYRFGRRWRMVYYVPGDTGYKA